MMDAGVEDTAVSADISSSGTAVGGGERSGEEVREGVSPLWGAAWSGGMKARVGHP